MSREKDIDLGGGVVARPGRKKKHLKVLHTLYESNTRDLPATLRKIAKQAEKGKFGIPNEGALVIDGSDGHYHVFGFGPHYDSPATTMMLFNQGLAELQDIFFTVKEAQKRSYKPEPKE